MIRSMERNRDEGVGRGGGRERVEEVSGIETREEVGSRLHVSNTRS